LKSTLSEFDRIIAGRDAIIRWLYQAGIVNGRKQPVKWESVRSWARFHGFPLLPGAQRGTANYSSCTSQHAIVAWVLSRMANGYPMRAFRN
jgi:hypothetical protein